MSNPFQSPSEARVEVAASPWWYLLFYRLFGPAWYLGILLLVCQWFELVSHAAGGVGIGMLAFAYAGNHLVPRLAGKRPEVFVILDSRLLKQRGADFRQTMQHFLDGATLMLDGAAFQLQPANDVACGIATFSPELSDSEAHEIVSHAQSVFDRLVQECPEFETSVCGKMFRISILYRGLDGTEVVIHSVDGNNPSVAI